MDSLTYLIYFCICEFGVLFCIGIAILIHVELSRLLTGGPLETAVNLAALGLVLCLGAGGSWISHNVAQRTSRDKEDPIAALQGAFSDARMYLSFLPWVGRFFRSRRPKRSPFDGPDDSDSI